jgi:hypothetical protein
MKRTIRDVALALFSAQCGAIWITHYHDAQIGKLEFLITSITMVAIFFGVRFWWDISPLGEKD